MNLYLDDLRDVPKGFVGARTVGEAISLMENNCIHTLSLDHDLGMDDEGNLRKTGYDLVKYVCEKGIRPANRIYLHTDNVVGRENMYQTLLAAQRKGFIDTDIKIFCYPFTRNRYSG
nr:cyclic-phosphate processing receiver domain-containing protein [Bacillus sp. Marseille-Q1617]